MFQVQGIQAFGRFFQKKTEVSLSPQGKQLIVFVDDDKFKFASEFRVLENLYL